MNFRNKVIALVTCAAMTFTLLPVNAFAAEPVTVTIFTTNDIHGVVEGDGAVGMAQAAAMKASTPNALLVDAGDATQGASFATVSQGKDVIRMMNAAGYDAMAAGNHEFDYGTDQLLANANEADFPILSANVTLNGKLMLSASTIVEAGGKSVGLIGLTTTDTATSTNPSKLKGVAFNDEAAAAKEQIAALAGETDAVVIICHMGDNEAAVDCTGRELLDALTDEELSEVAAVVDGHSHTVEQDIYTRNGISIPVVQAGVNFQNIGKIEITFDGSKITADGEVLTAEEAAGFTLTADGENAADQVQSVLAQIKAEQDEILGQTLCTNETPLWGGNIYWDYSEPRIVETSYGDFVTDAFAENAETFAEQNDISLPIVAVENGGGISAALPVGEVTRGTVLNAFSHGNMVEVYEVTPALLRAALENGLTVTGQDETGLLLRERVSGSFLQVSGFTYTYDPAAPSGEKVVSIELKNGVSLDLSDSETKLLLATNSYVGSSFASVGAKKLGELGGEDQIVMEYILSQVDENNVLNYSSGEERIKVYGDKSPETYTVKIPVLLASDDETAQPGVKVHLSIDGADAEEYITDENGNIVVEVTKGTHTFYLDESSDGQPVYTNNYSGSGTVTTRAGYYRLGFLADEITPEDLNAVIESCINYLNELADALRSEIEGNDLFTSEEQEKYCEAINDILNEGVAAIKASSTAYEAYKLNDLIINRMNIIMTEASVVYLERYYKEAIDEFDFATDEEKAKSRQAIDEILNDIKAALEAGQFDISSLLDKVNILNMAYSYSYLPHTYRYRLSRINNYNNLTEEEKAQYIEQIEDIYSEAADALENDPYSAETVDLVYTAISSIQSIEIYAWACDCINWTEQYIFDDFDSIISEYSAELKYITEDELAAIRQSFEEKAKSTCTAMKQTAEQDEFVYDISDFEDLRESMQSFFDDTIKQVFATNALNYLNSVAEEIKNDILELEKKNGTDMSEYISQIENIMTDANTSINAIKTTFQYVYDADALDKIFDEITALSEQYAEQLRTISDNIDDDNDNDNDDNPATGVVSETSSIMALMALSGFLAILPASSKIRKSSHKK